MMSKRIALFLAVLYMPVLVIGQNSILVDSLIHDPNNDNLADPFDSIEYELILDNTGGVPIGTAQINRIADPNTTLDPNRIRMSPLAIEDFYIKEDGIFGYSVDSMFGLLINDRDFDDALPNPPFVNQLQVIRVQGVDIGMGAVATENGSGTVTINSDGSFVFNQTSTGFLVDSFLYTVEDIHGLRDSDYVHIAFFSAEIAVRFRSFSNTGGNEIYLGVPSLGVGANRNEQGLTWPWNVPGGDTVTVIFNFEPLSDQTTAGADINSSGSITMAAPDEFVAYPNPPEDCSPGQFNSLKVLIREDQTQAANISVLNLRLYENSNLTPGTLGGTLLASELPSNSTFQNYNFLDSSLQDGFSIHVDIGKTDGAIATGQESNRVEIIVGCTNQ